MIMLCAAFTPLTTGADLAEVPVPYGTDGVTSVAWNIVRAGVRVQTAGSQSVVAIEKSTSTGAFTAVSIGTVTLGANAYEAATTSSLGTINSGNKTRFNVLTLGTGQNWTVTVEISHP
jgi:hypothetical protein